MSPGCRKLSMTEEIWLANSHLLPAYLTIFPVYVSVFKFPLIRTQVIVS